VTRPGRRKRAESLYAEQAVQLAARVRALRDQHGLTQQELAARAQVAIGTVRNIETATVVEPGYFTVLALLEALSIEEETERG
jgi:transcriptional regulator with XRE-family HTH domain